MHHLSWLSLSHGLKCPGAFLEGPCEWQGTAPETKLVSPAPESSAHMGGGDPDRNRRRRLLAECSPCFSLDLAAPSSSIGPCPLFARYPSSGPGPDPGARE